MPSISIGWIAGNAINGTKRIKSLWKMLSFGNEFVRWCKCMWLHFTRSRGTRTTSGTIVQISWLPDKLNSTGKHSAKTHFHWSNSLIKDSRNLIFAFGGEYTNAFSIKKLAGKPAFFASITMRKRQVLRKVLTKIDPVRYDFSKRSSLNFPFTGIFKIDIILFIW